MQGLCGNLKNPLMIYLTFKKFLNRILFAKKSPFTYHLKNGIKPLCVELQGL